MKDHDPGQEAAELAALGEAPATPEERRQAASLGRLVDGLLLGKAPPPALEADERALVETATALQAALGDVQLDEARQADLLDDVFRSPRRVASMSVAPPGTSGERPAVGPARAANPRHARARLGRVAPWAVAAICAAAALWLALRPPVATPPRGAPPAYARLRSTDAVVGAPIPEAQAADASARLDALVADRRAARRGQLGGPAPGGRP